MSTCLFLAFLPDLITHPMVASKFCKIGTPSTPKGLASTPKGLPPPRRAGRSVRLPGRACRYAPLPAGVTDVWASPLSSSSFTPANDAAPSWADESDAEEGFPAG
eukprot:gnl/TRDRNA2_/TRDRNA2_86272_c0_seq1.p2 gnl/TRDRNA2_/TRDRNA2_86272_c0~~gnl/TRDRNA2_/TRDRNA2_86272_c0_seq1.p2  ORF type:complete len:105 (+),score=8.22 gnl/TRDRNA2_/TRDRNA2_86272_c0_seq1:631-945(+)